MGTGRGSGWSSRKHRRRASSHIASAPLTVRRRILTPSGRDAPRLTASRVEAKRCICSGVPTGGSEATGAAGSGGLPAATGGASVGGSTTGGDGAALSSNSDIAAAIQRHDVACEAACTLALQCQPVLETVEECQNIFLCLELAFRVDASDVSPAAMLECLDAATAHTDCVAALTCEEYYGWRNENVDPFPCSVEQSAEDVACADTALFYDPNG